MDLAGMSTMESHLAERDARVTQLLDELDDVEAKIEDLRPVDEVRSRVLFTVSLLVIVAAVVVFLFVPNAWDLVPFLLAAVAYASFGLKSLSSKNEELADLENERARVVGGPIA